jgi:tetratricopeptide (TPR) repeat protein/predicted Ser/Thr protein kinase
MAPPARFGRFQVVGELGKGAMGIVYKAVDPIIDRVVAIKTLSEEARLDEDLVDRFTREARSAGILNHPNIITVYDVGEEGGTPFLALEYLQGRTLEETIQSGDEIPFEKRIQIICSTALGLAHAHERGVVHRDIKPGNIFLTDDGTTKITDFGIARSTVTEKTKPGVILGSIGYMAPEQIKGLDLDGRVDIFAVGIIAHELLTGKRTFPGDNIMQVMNQVLNTDALPVSRVSKDAPPEFDPVVAKALRRDREERYQKADRFAEDLQHALAAWKKRTRGGTVGLDEEMWTPISAEELFGEAEFDSPVSEPPAAIHKGWTEIALVCAGVVVLSGLILLGFLYVRNKQRNELEAQVAKNFASLAACLEAGDYEKAFSEAEWILTKDPHNLKARELRDYSQTLVDKRLDVPPLLKKADLDYRLGQIERAKETYRKILDELDPANEEAKKRIEEIENALLQRKRVELLLAEANGLYDSAAFSGARTKWQEVLKLDPENGKAKEGIRIVDQLLLGNADLDEWYEKAEQARLLEDYAGQADYLKRIVDAMGDEGRWERIRGELNIAKAMLDRQRQIESWHNKAERLYSEGEYEQAIDICNKILETDIRNAWAREMIRKAQDALRG